MGRSLIIAMSLLIAAGCASNPPAVRVVALKSAPTTSEEIDCMSECLSSDDEDCASCVKECLAPTSEPVASLAAVKQ